MRTTLTIADDVLVAARAVADRDGVSIGEAISRLARRGLAPPGLRRRADGFPVVDVAPDAGPITSADVAHVLADE